MPLQESNPLVTIICTSYNHSQFVCESLDSVISQTYKNIELIIVDDASTDNSVETIEKWIAGHPEVKFIRNNSNLGITKSFNRAIKAAHGDYIIDLAADDVLLPDCVSLQIDAFAKSSLNNTALVYGNCELITDEGCFERYYFEADQNKKVVKKRLTGDIYTSVLTGGDSICSVTAMVKKEVFDALGGYDETLAYEDLDFWIRLTRTYDVDFTDEILVQKRTVSTSHSNNFYSIGNPITLSTVRILKKAFRLNRSREEDLALQKRIHHGIVHAYDIRDFLLLARYLWLKTLLTFRFQFAES